MNQARFDAVVLGAGHNGLVAATMLAGAGRSVMVLERRAEVGGAVASTAPFPGVDARLSRFAYLVSLLPASLADLLGLRLDLRRRRTAWYAPVDGGGALAGQDEERTRESITRATGDPQAFGAWQRFYEQLSGVAQRLFPTLLEPLRSREQIRRMIGDDAAFGALFQEPLSALLERSFDSDLLRGVACTDATIGTFAPADDPLLRQNRCFLYHVIGNGTGQWDVPVGGMGVITDQLSAAARGAGAQILTGQQVVGLATDGVEAEVTCADGRRLQAGHILANVAPQVLARLLGEPAPEAAPEGSQLKINMLLARLPRLRDRRVTAEEAFTGTFHVNEGYDHLQQSYREAAAGRVPDLPPCEAYCHSLTDPSILSPELMAAGAQTLTVFGLHMPARLFLTAPEERKLAAVRATLASVDSVLAEPLEDCLFRAPDGQPCIEVLSPVDLERELAMPGGHIFHRDLTWPFAESEAEVGKWGVETKDPNVWLCGAGARRGGCVSGIPGHNAARAVLSAR